MFVIDDLTVDEEDAFFATLDDARGLVSAVVGDTMIASARRCERKERCTAVAG